MAKTKPLDKTKVPANLQSVWDELQRQVSTKGISQEQANAELQRQMNMGSAPAQSVYAPNTPVPPTSTLSPYLQQAQQNLANQVASGGINQSQANLELERLKGIEQQTSPSVGANLPLSSASDVINATGALGKQSQVAGNLLTNPNQQNDFGSQTLEIDPLTGQPTVKQNLSKGNQDVLTGIQGGAQDANSALRALLGGGVFGSLTNPAQEGGPGPQSNFENAVFQQLTRGLDTQKAQEYEAKKQELANRGIPVGSAAFSAEMNRFDKRWDDQFRDARSQAVTAGNSQALSSLASLANVGRGGLYTPNFQGFNAVAYQQPDIGSLFGQLQQGQQFSQGLAQDKYLAEQEMQLRRDLAKKTGGGGGGGDQPTSAFNTGRPPGS